MEIRSDFLPLSRPSISDEEIEAVVACLKSGWLTTGPLCQRFEERFCELTGARYALAVSSGTAGMHLLLTALGISRGDEVITPSLTFASTVNMITRLGAKPVFVDVDYGTMNIDPSLIEEKITPRTKAVIPVHFAGAPADMDKILRIARRYDLYVIEDAAHAVGARYRGIHAGGFGVHAVFSFHPIKNITTGEGGMITSDDGDLIERLRGLRFHGIERDAWKRYGKGGNPHYDIETPGYKYNLTDIQAALGLAQLSRLEELNVRRTYLANIYLERLARLSGLHVPALPSYPHTHAWHLFVVKILDGKREEVMEGLSRFNIGYGLHFPPCHLLNYIRRLYPLPEGSLPITEGLGTKILSLPLFPGMTEDDVHYVCDALGEILGGLRP